jgi:GNAT superfamily N-acetyltransferase
VPVKLREYEARDATALRQCVVALQEFERLIDANLRPGDLMADEYCAKLHERCQEASGHILVAEHDDEVVGFVAVLAREPFTELDDPPGTYALVTDLVVLATHRGKGIGRRLLDRAEAYARDAGAAELRVGVLAKNTAARRLYLSRDFTPHLEVLAKRLR